MSITVTYSEEPIRVLSGAGEFLASQPVLHNLILSILHARIARPEPGRYWVAMERDEAVGVVLQSPVTFPATLTPMAPEVAAALVDAIVASGVSLPGVNGHAATAASFAGQWAERSKSAATPFQGNRLYELLERAPVPQVRGTFRQASPRDRNLIVHWTDAFLTEIGEPTDDVERRVDHGLAAGQYWVWEDGATLSMAVGREPLEGVVRVSEVYTPPDKRNRGYAAACVHALSAQLRDAGFRAVLYADLANSTANSMYRRIGYRTVAEVLRYRFD